MQEYLGITGLPQFCQLAQKLAFGDCPAVTEGRIVTAQSLSGTGSLRVAAEFLSNFYSSKTILVCQPTWGNHNKIFPKGGLTVALYRYYDPGSRGLDIDGMLQDLNRAELGAIVLLHACAHNPTGVDPSREQWGRILQVVQQRKLFCLFDSAYQVCRLGLIFQSLHTGSLPHPHCCWCLPVEKVLLLPKRSVRKVWHVLHQMI
jgi:aspartate/tyrosine/aromatic aminotransferase